MESRYNNLTTEYEKELGRDAVPWNVYPRPGLCRDSFICLNGQWDLYLPGDQRGSIEKMAVTVPFPPQSKASGIMRDIRPEHVLIYSKFFDLEDFSGSRMLLHFGAVDRLCRVYLNGNKLGEHDGGYSPFTFEITKFAVAGKNELTIEVEDNLSPLYPYGKQRYKRGGMWYTPICGIWQTVWCEKVPVEYIENIKIDSSTDSVTMQFFGGAEEKYIEIKTPVGVEKHRFSGDTFHIQFRSPREWTPDDPYLYRYTVKCGGDKIEGYFALREIMTEGNRIYLNGKPVFLHALLDQGYYSDGIFLPSSPKGYEDDILLAKKLGFNTLRKHIKLEPMLFYYYCDLHGMLVMQDCINNGKYSFFLDTALPTVGIKKGLVKRVKKEQKELFRKQMVEMAELLYNCPSVIYYTIFNEGWGQFKGDCYEVLKNVCGGRVIDTASGWFIPQKSDVVSEHVYFKKFRMRKNDNKPVILSEFGGYAYRIAENCFNPSKKYGYKFFENKEKFSKGICEMYQRDIIPNIENGLCGAVLTQLSDVEDEVNGMITYDRQKVKIDVAEMKGISSRLYKAFSKSCKNKKH